MTLERASELIAALPDSSKRADLFVFFEQYFHLAEKGPEYIENFARMCGYAIAGNVRPL